MIDVISFKGKDYPLFQASGFAARFAFPFAQEVCKGIGFDIGCNRKEWSLKDSIPIDITIQDEWDAMKLPDLFVDYIFSSHCLEHLPNWVEALDYWAKHLKAKATLFLYLPHRSQEYWLPINNRKHIHFFDEKIMKQYFESSNYFSNVFISGPDLNNSFYVIAEKKMKVKINNIELEVENDNQFWSHIDNWEPHSFKILERYLNKDNCLIDVGAWNGVLSLYASKLCKNVIAFEPDKKAFEHFNRNIELNSIDNISSFNVACSDKNGFIDLYTRCEGDSTSSLIDRIMEGYICENHYKVESINLSEVLPTKNIGLIKIDIEGGEIFLLPALKDYLKKYKPNLYISFHPNWFTDKDNQINQLIGLLLENYSVFNINFEKVDKEYLLNSLYSKEHSFIFTNEL